MEKDNLMEIINMEARVNNYIGFRGEISKPNREKLLTDYVLIRRYLFVIQSYRTHRILGKSDKIKTRYVRYERENNAYYFIRKKIHLK